MNRLVLYAQEVLEMVQSLSESHPLIEGLLFRSLLYQFKSDAQAFHFDCKLLPSLFLLDP
jgi:hypothetical protein